MFPKMSSSDDDLDGYTPSSLPPRNNSSKIKTLPLIIGVTGKINHGKNWFAETAAKHCKKKTVEMFAFADALKQSAAVLLNKPIDNFYVREKKELPLEPEVGVTNDDYISRIVSVLSIITGEPAETFHEAEENMEIVLENGMNPMEMAACFMVGLAPFLCFDEKTNTLNPRGGTNSLFCQWLGTEVVRDCVDERTWISVVERKIKNSVANVVFITDVRFPDEVDMIKKFGGVVVRVEGLAIDSSTRDPKHPSETALDAVMLPTFVNDRSMEQNSLPGLFFRSDVYFCKEAAFREITERDKKNTLVCVRHGYAFFRMSSESVTYEFAVRQKILEVLPKRKSTFNGLADIKAA